MAQVVLSVRVAWWVRPYLSILTVFARSISPFVEVDDDRIEAFAQRQSTFIRKHGLKLYAGNKRLRD